MDVCKFNLLVTRIICVVEMCCCWIFLAEFTFIS